MLDVGKQCCANLTAEINLSGHLRFYKSALRRKETFLKSPLWRRVGRSLFRRYANLHCETHPDEAGRRLKLTCERLGEIPGRTLFASEGEAKALLFDLVVSGELFALFLKRFERSEWVAPYAPRTCGVLRHTLCLTVHRAVENAREATPE